MSISYADFVIGCTQLSRRWSSICSDGTAEDWKLLSAHDTSFIRITRPLQLGTECNSGIMEDSAEMLEETDEEALQPAATVRSKLSVAYEIIHSPSYQVPVLYLTTKGQHAGGQPSLEDVYDILVPNSRRSEMQAVGVLGALSSTEHPLLGMPAYFVHPCRTQEAMAAVSGGHTLRSDEYLLKWLGIVGGSVGLHVPLELATSMSREAG